MKTNLLTFFLLVFFASAVFAQEGPLESLMDVYRVDHVMAEDGSHTESLVPATEAAPGEQLEYLLTYRNRGTEPLRGFVIRNRIPDDTSYVGNSSSSSVAGDFLVSIDFGVTWEAVPVTRVVVNSEGVEQTITIPADQYTNLSWQVDEWLAPDDSFELRYRVSID